jgi:signal transduction protein with GAF and PtsI domain
MFRGGFSMSHFAWEPESLEESHVEQEPQEPEEHELEALQPIAVTENLALSPDDFSALEERILRAVDLVKRSRVASAAAEERAQRAEVQLRAQMPLVEQLQKEVEALRAERDQVRQRVERLLAQLDSIEL